MSNIPPNPTKSEMISNLFKYSLKIKNASTDDIIGVKFYAKNIVEIAPLPTQ